MTQLGDRKVDRKAGLHREDVLSTSMDLLNLRLPSSALDLQSAGSLLLQSMLEMGNAGPFKTSEELSKVAPMEGFPILPLSTPFGSSVDAGQQITLSNPSGNSSPTVAPVSGETRLHPSTPSPAVSEGLSQVSLTSDGASSQDRHQLRRMDQSIKSRLRCKEEPAHKKNYSDMNGGMEVEDDFECDAEDFDEEEPPVGNKRKAGAGAGKGKEKKKVGRPITYKGDINSPHLTDQERRRIKRRIANRESARRVRQKRQEFMDEISRRLQGLQQQNARLIGHLAEVEQQKSMIASQISQMRDQWTATASENMRLKAEIATLRNVLQVDGGMAESENMKTEAAGPAATPASGAPAVAVSMSAASVFATTGLPPFSVGGNAPATSGAGAVGPIPMPSAGASLSLPHAMSAGLGAMRGPSTSLDWLLTQPSWELNIALNEVVNG